PPPRSPCKAPAYRRIPRAPSPRHAACSAAEYAPDAVRRASCRLASSRRVLAQRRLDLGDRLLDVVVGHMQEIEVGGAEVLHVGRAFALRDGPRDRPRRTDGGRVLAPG